MIKEILNHLRLKLIWHRFDVDERLLLKKLRLKGSVIYDIGAYKGNLTKLFLKKTGKNGTVICFEPNPSTYQLIKNRFKKNPRIKILKTALGKRDKKGRFFYSNGLEALTSKYDPSRVQPVRIRKLLTFECRVRKLDNLKASPIPNLIKVDVEGMEFEVILGAKKLIKRHKPDLLLEIHHTSLKDPEQRKNINQSLDLLKELKYKLYWTHQKKRVSEFKIGHVFCSTRANPFV
ncbi:MAG: FkbM family methyltransferase [Candidatus Berkelbacteria bacterium]|nr:FkbM family methyltransferase [Candidatus Berkelbacteria bacterium]